MNDFHIVDIACGRFCKETAVAKAADISIKNRNVRRASKNLFSSLYTVAYAYWARIPAIFSIISSSLSLNLISTRRDAAMSISCEFSM